MKEEYLPESTKRAQILIIDDELPFCLSVQELLHLHGYNADYALSIREGRAFLEKHPETDILLLDIHFDNGLNGIEALPLLKEKSPYIQIIMLTSDTSVDAGVGCIKKGAYDYITKPIEEQEFLKKLAGAYEKKNLDQLKDLYFKIIVHDFKKPLQGMSMAVETLISGDSSKFTPGESHLLSMAQYSCWQLDNMVKNILHVTRFEEEGIRLRYESFVLSREIDSHLKILFDTIVLYEKEYELQSFTGPGYILKTDKDLFFRVFANIIDNAITFTPAGLKITIRIKEMNNSSLHISVINQGSYIEEEQRDKIFHKFYKARNAATCGKANFGLGLTFCSAAVKMLDGRIWVESNRERNETEFHFTVKNYLKE